MGLEDTALVGVAGSSAGPTFIVEYTPKPVILPSISRHVALALLLELL